MELVMKGKKLPLNRTLIMGILNVTPDSFSDGGLWFDPEKAAAHAARMASDGADIIDIGGESTRPGAAEVGVEDEISRVVPVIKAIRARGLDIPISVDTYKSATAKEALQRGADMINDISGGTFDPAIMETAASTEAGFVIMHIKGRPGTMQEEPVYSGEGVVHDILGYFRERTAAAVKAGIKMGSIVLDPGIGFGKTLKHNLEILDRLDEFKSIGLPLLVGTSRKSMIGKVLGALPEKRLFGTAATVALSIAKGADIVRVHDVKEIREVTKMSDAVIRHHNTEAV